MDGAELGPDVIVRDAMRQVIGGSAPVKVVEDGQLLGVVDKDNILSIIVAEPSEGS